MKKASPDKRWGLLLFFISSDLASGLLACSKATPWKPRGFIIYS